MGISTACFLPLRFRKCHAPLLRPGAWHLGAAGHVLSSLLSALRRDTICPRVGRRTKAAPAEPRESNNPQTCSRSAAVPQLLHQIRGANGADVQPQQKRWIDLHAPGLLPWKWILSAAEPSPDQSGWAESSLEANKDWVCAEKWKVEEWFQVSQNNEKR